MDTHDLVPLKTGSSTFVRQSGKLSHLDLAVTNISIASVANWSVINETLGDDHLPIVIKLNIPVVMEETAVPLWSYRRLPRLMMLRDEISKLKIKCSEHQI